MIWNSAKFATFKSFGQKENILHHYPPQPPQLIISFFTSLPRLFASVAVDQSQNEKSLFDRNLEIRLVHPLHCALPPLTNFFPIFFGHLGRKIKGILFFSRNDSTQKRERKALPLLLLEMDKRSFLNGQFSFLSLERYGVLFRMGWDFVGSVKTLYIFQMPFSSFYF